MVFTVAGALLPVFGLILLGYVCGRVNVLGDRAFEVLNRFVIAITLPILTFRTLAHMDASDLAVPAMVGAVLGGAFITYALGYWIERYAGQNAAEANIVGLSASFSNTGFIGLPVALLVFGQASLGPVAVTMALYSSIVFGIAVLLSEMALHQQAGWAVSLRHAGAAIVRSPLIIMSVVGVFWACLGLPLSGPVDVLLQTLASATAPCALMAIGLFIAIPRETAAPAPIVRVTVMKLVAHPLITAGVILMSPPMPVLWKAVAILMAAMPCGAASFVIAGKAGRWAMEVSARAVTLTTVLASLTLIPFIWWLAMA